MFTKIKLGNQEYEAHLGFKDMVEIEKRLGYSILNVFQKGDVPSLEAVSIILHQSLQARQHGIKLDKVMDLIDSMECQDKLTKLYEYILKIFVDSGLISNQDGKN